MMSVVTRAFFVALLTENLVFMTFIGAAVAVVFATTVRRSAITAVRVGAMLFITAVISTAFSGDLAVILQFLLALVSVGILWQFGDLRDSWQGMPGAVLAVPLFMGVQLLIQKLPSLGEAFATSGGMALGFAGAFLLVASVRETARLSEANQLFKTNPVVIFSMAIFALICTGFLFW